MATLGWNHCKCGIDWEGLIGDDTRCYDCRTREDGDKRKVHFDVLDAMTTEQRIRRIETLIYDYVSSTRLGDLRF